MKGALRLLGGLAAGWLAVCMHMFVTQRSMQYRPDGSAMDPARAGLPQASQFVVDAADGERIVLWWIPPLDASAPVFLYLHGNGANLEARAQRFAHLTRSGRGLLAVSWRGYGGSTGSPTETGLRTDARAGYDWLSARVDPSRIIVFGESLGTTVSVLLAAEVPVRALVLDSSFSSALDVARGAYPWLPVSLLMLDRYLAVDAAPRVRVPVQQFHCDDDPVTPAALAERLNAALPAARPVSRVSGRCHVPPVTRFEPALEGFLTELIRF